jgi:hypothetical protein
MGSIQCTLNANPVYMYNILIDYSLLFYIHMTIFHTYGDVTIAGAPVRIRVRIDPPYPLVCRKRRLNGAVLRMRPEKPRSHVTAGVAR